MILNPISMKGNIRLRTVFAYAILGMAAIWIVILTKIMLSVEIDFSPVYALLSAVTLFVCGNVRIVLKYLFHVNK